MKIDLNISADDINKELVSAILNGSVGQAIKTGIELQLEDLTKSGWDNPIQKTIHEIVVTIIKEETMKHESEIRELIASRITANHIEQAIKRLGDVLTRSY